MSSQRKFVSTGNEFYTLDTIKKIGDLAKSNTFFLIDNFGSNILKYKEIALGNDKTGVNNKIFLPKSSSREITFEEDIELKECKKYIYELSDPVIKDISNATFKTISIKVRFENFSTITRDFSLKYNSSKKEDIIRISEKLLKNVISDKKIRLFGIKVSNLNFIKEKQLELNSFIINKLKTI